MDAAAILDHIQKTYAVIEARARESVASAKDLLASARKRLEAAQR